MALKKSIVLVAAALALFACSDESSDIQKPELAAISSSSVEGVPYSSNSSVHIFSPYDEWPGMFRIPVTNIKINLAEKMDVSLTYEFFIGVHEVTCEEYGDQSCAGDSLPVANVTFFDAVLFANAKSKAESMDTVYTYTKATFDSQNHCTYLENFATNYDKLGYRLPTEAEWIKVASWNWNIENSWNSGNSGNVPHRVCSSNASYTTLCDFAGNVMEWVNDWLGPTTDSSYRNFIGAAQPNGIGERIVKGGSFANDIQSINMYSRGDVYTVTSSTRADYVGFRLALGIIPNPQAISNSAQQGGQNITNLANSDIIRGITGTYAAKLAFRNDVTGNLVFINYSDITLSMVEIQDTLNVYHPDISPDGKWVAFCTGMEGVGGTSSLYVRKLDATGSSLVKLNVESAAIPRWSVTANGDTVITYVTDAGNNKETADWQQSSTWQVPFAGGAFGIPQKLFDGSYHGGISTDGSIAVSGSKLLRARTAAPSSSVYAADATDNTWYNGEQACNVSLVNDSTNRVAFLDFGGNTGKEFVGTPYATHQRILIANKSGQLIQSIGAPAGYTFDHTEWATNGEISNIVATLTNLDGAHTKIVLVNVNDSSVTELIQGEELWHPCLWVNRTSTSISTDNFALDPDSAGKYFVAGGTEIAVKWRYKMELLWNYRDSVNTVILGSSRALHGVIPQQLGNGIKAINLANSNNTLYCTKFILYNYVLPHMKNLKNIIMSIDIDRGFNTAAQSFFEVNRSSIPGYVYDENHNFWKDGVPEQLPRLTTESMGYSKFEPYRETLGFEALEANGWGEPKIWTDSMWVSRRRDLYDASVVLLKEILAVAQAHNVRVLGVIFPQNPLYASTGSFSFHGIQRSIAPTLIQELADLSKTYPNFTLMDENKMGDHDYTDGMAYDNNHLSVDGAIQMTLRIRSVLASMMAQ
ncbi:MAG: TIGR02171 family protein [Fibrobacter sp.]|nr:TIGR02171 family protein [Fibrobacter sp.]